MAEITTPGSDQSQAQFLWSFDGRLVAVDHGASLAGKPSFKDYMALDSFAVISFDPADRLAGRADLEELGEFQCIRHAALGDGRPVTFHACLDQELSGTLEPCPKPLSTLSTHTSLDVDPVLARLPMNSVRLDAIEGVPQLDWLILGGGHDNLVILEHGTDTLADTLLVDAVTPFQRIHQEQSDFTRMNQWMHRHGFRFHCFQQFDFETRLPSDRMLEKQQASLMRRANGIYLPTDERLQQMSRNALLKLSFLLHSVYKLKDMAFHVLQQADPVQARAYLVAEGFLWPVDEDETVFTLTAEYSPDLWNTSHDNTAGTTP